jgi:hypothetical protein
MSQKNVERKRVIGWVAAGIAIVAIGGVLARRGPTEGQKQVFEALEAAGLSE